MSSYKDSGVDVQGADAWVERVAADLGGQGPAEMRARLKSGVGAYAAVYALNDQQWLALSCDGVGTKLLWTQQGVGRVEDLAQDLVAMNANDLLCVGARPTLFLDYLGVGSLSVCAPHGALGGFMAALSRASAESGMIVVGGETAQMPDLYGEQGYDLAGFAVGTLDPEDFLSIERVQVGSELWGWPSSGPHSNGFSWLRKLFSEEGEAEKNWIRSHLMPPTRLYARDLLRLREALGARKSALEAAFHITGSGALNLLRAQPKGRSIGFDLRPWEARSRPEWLQELGKRVSSEMDLWRTFNMGIGFAVVLDRDLVEKEKPLLDSLGLTHLGTVTARPVLELSQGFLE